MTQTQIPLAPPTGQPVVATPLALSVKGLTKRYGDHEVVSNVSFDVPKGAVFGLLGPNGAGKTTIMKCVLGLVSTTAGEVTLLGSSKGDAQWATKLRRVGAMIEAPPLYMNMSARKNLEYQRRAVGLRNNDTAIAELLELVDLSDRADDKPKGYSLGMKQRLGIAVSLINDPELIVLDEPANGLDPQGIVEIRELLRRLPSRGVTVLVSSHQLSEVQQACDRLLIMSEGAVIEAGSTDEILRRNNHVSLDLTFDSDQNSTRARQILSGHGLVPHAISPRLVRLEEDLAGAVVNRLLADEGVYAASISSTRASLEETFLNLTTSA